MRFADIAQSTAAPNAKAADPDKGTLLEGPGAGVTTAQAQAMYSALASQLNSFLSSQLSASARQQLGSFIPDKLTSDGASYVPLTLTLTSKPLHFFCSLTLSACVD
jgi:hypothetical protein